jgi:hypothetical protein
MNTKNDTDLNSRSIPKEPLWHMQIAVLVAVVLQFVLSAKFSVGPRYIVAVAELVLLFGLTATTPRRPDVYSQVRRIFSVGLIAVISLMNAGSLFLLSSKLIQGGINNAGQLLASAMSIYFTNIIIFGLWYWEIDGGGPGKRTTRTRRVDFLYPQMSTPEYEPHKWQPFFFDYLYVSLTNGTAFSPTDTMPLTHRAKVLMSLQSLISLTTVALVAARAVNILR